MTPEWPEISPEAKEAIEGIRRRIDALPPERRPKVCISSITYNHAPFLAQTLEGFVMQQTDFPFVAVVHDDASTDGTADILRQYAERYPDIIFPIFERENQYSKPGGPLTLIMHLAQEATGAPYIAKCEGDDYWTSPHKLQLQADFLDTHPDYVMCSTGCTWHNTITGEIKEYSTPNLTYSWDCLLSNTHWPLQTLTILYRKDAIDISDFLKYKYRIDMVFFWNILHKGLGYQIPENTSVYHVHGGGVWASCSPIKNWETDFKIRKDVYDVEQNKDSAIFLLRTLPRNGVGRSWLLRHKRKEIWQIFTICSKYFGKFFVFKEIVKFFTSGRDIMPNFYIASENQTREG